jgi:ribosomal subunit interface protein
MRVQIAARKCEIPDSVRSRTEQQLGKLSKYEPRLSGADVVFKVEKKHLKKVEAVLSVDRGEPVVAGGEGAEFREALDLMVDRLSKILRRRRSQKTDHHGPSISETVPSED